MMRIDKQIELLLKKSSWPTYGTNGGAKLKGFARRVMERVFDSPEVDLLAAQFGFRAEDMWGPDSPTDVQLDLQFNLTDDPEVQWVSGSTYQDGTIEVLVNYEAYENDDVEYASEIVFHELVHVLDVMAETIGAAPSWYPVEEWMESVDEQEAIMGQVLDLINSGYSDDELMAIFRDEFEREFKPAAENPEKAWTKYKAIIEQAIKDIRQSDYALVEE